MSAMWRITLLVALVATTINPQARAQSAGSTDAEITGLKKQIRLLEEKLDKIQKRTDARIAAIATAPAKPSAPNNSAALPVKSPTAPPEAVVLMPNNRPTICTADQQNCVAITSRLHFDVGGYDYHPNTAATVPQRLDDGFNARRARIGVLGKFWGDWNYALIYDFAGSSDGFAGTASVGGASVGFLPGGGLSGIQNAYLRIRQRAHPAHQGRRRRDRRHEGSRMTARTDHLDRTSFPTRAMASVTA
jgi:phosphate-selective porin OprO/OprP